MSVSSTTFAATRGVFARNEHRQRTVGGIDPTGAKGWGQQLQENVSRNQVAKLILSSLESDQIVTESLYNQFLYRAADPGGLNATMAALQQGMPNELVIAIIAGSEEYLSRV
jgi:hypothetical protein